MFRDLAESYELLNNVRVIRFNLLNLIPRQRSRSKNILHFTTNACFIHFTTNIYNIALTIRTAAMHCAFPLPLKRMIFQAKCTVKRDILGSVDSRIIYVASSGLLHFYCSRYRKTGNAFYCDRRHVDLAIGHYLRRASLLLLHQGVQSKQEREFSRKSHQLT